MVFAVRVLGTHAWAPRFTGEPAASKNLDGAIPGS
jgi:hypothetical protein